jgi:hypothetical protein
MERLAKLGGATESISPDNASEFAGHAMDAWRATELGERHPSACAMQGLHAVHIVSDYCGDAYRGICTML